MPHYISYSRPIAVAQLAVLPLPPAVHLALGRQRQAVLPARVHCHLLDEHVLYGLEQGRGGHGVRTGTKATAGTVTRRIHL